MWTIYCYLSSLLIVVTCGRDFKAFSVISVVPKSQLDLDYIANITNSDEKKVSYWFTRSELNKPVKLLIRPDNRESVFSGLIGRELIPKIVINDLGSLIVEHKGKDYGTNQSFDGDNLNFFKSYHRLAVIENYLAGLVSRSQKKIITTSFGQSFEKRDLTLIRISSPIVITNNTYKRRRRSKPVIYIQGGIHAREWISPATVIYMINAFAKLSDSDATIRKLIDYFEYWFVPIVNPDGYEYSHSHERFWRKTRSKTLEDEICIGVDANRNFDHNWGALGVDLHDPCSDTYPGPKPNSEPEVIAIRDLIYRNAFRIKAFFDFHSFDQSWLIPYGFSTNTSFTEDYADMERIAKKSTNALASIHGTRYSVGNKAKLLYPASGLSDDWAKGVAKIKYSFSIELSDKGEFGFLLPASRIISVGEEITEAIKVFSLELMKELKRCKSRRRKNKPTPRNN